MLDQSTEEPEEWRAVVGWEGFYEVSDQGRVRRHPSHGHRLVLLLKPIVHKRGYLYVHLKRKPIRSARTVHSLVAEAFIGPYPYGHEVNHRDGVKANCAKTNLEYVLQADNIHHAIATGLTPHPRTFDHPRGSAHHNAVLTEADVLAIRSEPAHHGVTTELARKYGVSNVLIGLIRAGKAWKHLPMPTREETAR